MPATANVDKTVVRFHIFTPYRLAAADIFLTPPRGLLPAPPERILSANSCRVGHGCMLPDRNSIDLPQRVRGISNRRSSSCIFASPIRSRRKFDPRIKLLSHLGERSTTKRDSVTARSKVQGSPRKSPVCHYARVSTSPVHRDRLAQAYPKVQSHPSQAFCSAGNCEFVPGWTFVVGSVLKTMNGRTHPPDCPGFALEGLRKWRPWAAPGPIVRRHRTAELGR